MTTPPPGKVARQLQKLRDDNDALRALITAIGDSMLLPQPVAVDQASFIAARDVAITIAVRCRDVAAQGGDPRDAIAAIRAQRAESAASYEHWVPARGEDGGAR
jgi:selenophosphate synthetase-related protein